MGDQTIQLLLIDALHGILRFRMLFLFTVWCRWYTMTHADGSISQTFGYLKQNGLQGFIDIWPKPSAIAWKIIAVYAAFEAALQLLLPGKRVEGPVSPNGNRPIYKVIYYQLQLPAISVLPLVHFLNLRTWNVSLLFISYIFIFIFLLLDDMPMIIKHLILESLNHFWLLHCTGKWCGSIFSDIGYLSWPLVVRVSPSSPYVSTC